MTFETLLRGSGQSPANADANLVRNFVRNLRCKLGESAASPAYLFDERRVGYRMAKPRTGKAKRDRTAGRSGPKSREG